MNSAYVSESASHSPDVHFAALTDDETPVGAFTPHEEFVCSLSRLGELFPSPAGSRISNDRQ